jgi:hypothetical protein
MLVKLAMTSLRFQLFLRRRVTLLGTWVIRVRRLPDVRLRRPHVVLLLGAREVGTLQVTLIRRPIRVAELSLGQDSCRSHKRRQRSKRCAYERH